MRLVLLLCLAACTGEPAASAPTDSPVDTDSPSEPLPDPLVIAEALLLDCEAEDRWSEERMLGFVTVLQVDRTTTPTEVTETVLLFGNSLFESSVGFTSCRAQYRGLGDLSDTEQGVDLDHSFTSVPSQTTCPDHYSYRSETFRSEVSISLLSDGTALATLPSGTLYGEGMHDGEHIYAITETYCQPN